MFVVRRDQADGARRKFERARRHSGAGSPGAHAYREVGLDTVLIRGFDPLGDVVGWGRELIPRICDLAETIPVGGSGA